MAIEDTMRSLREFDVTISTSKMSGLAGSRSSLVWVDLDRCCPWPVTTTTSRSCSCSWRRSKRRKSQLKKEFEKKAFQAANLEAYRQQMVEMEESFGALVSQLPSDTEVPGLLEDITNKGLLNGLEIGSY